MYSKEEKRFIELRSKLFTELEDLEKQIAALEERRDKLTSILDGTHEPIDEERIPGQVFILDKEQLDNIVVNFVREYGPVARKDISAYFTEEGANLDDVRRALERVKRRGLVTVEGHSKAAVWSAI